MSTQSKGPESTLILHDGMQDEETQFKLRAMLGIHYGGGLNALLMSYDVHFGADGVPRVTHGNTPTWEQLDVFLNAIQKTAMPNVVLPGNVISRTAQRVAWHVPSARRPIWFHTRLRPEMKDLGGQVVAHPALLFIAEPGHLQLYALAGDERPTAATPVYQAPYPNVYETGGVCAGSVAWPRTMDVTKLSEWEESWFRSAGTFPTAAHLTLFPGGHAALWRAMREAERFPAETLVPLGGMTVLDAINHTERPRTLPFATEVIVPVPEALPEAGHA